MATPVILSLNSAIGIVKDKRDIAAYIVRQYFSNPGKTSELFEEELISFNKTRVLYNNNLDRLVEDVESSLREVLKRYMPNDDISIEAKAVNIQDTSRYNIELRVYINDNGKKELILIEGRVYISGTVLQLVLGQNDV